MSTVAAETRSLWWEQLPARLAHRPSLARDLDVDVAVVGAGYTGLWTAHYLLAQDPSLRIVVLDRDHVGFGASGRNGGWCYDGFAADLSRIERGADLDTAVHFGALLREAVDEVGRVCASEGIECDFTKGGNVQFVRNGGQLARATQKLEQARRYGWAESDLRLVGAEEALSIGRAAGVLGGLVSRHAAAIQPAKLVHGLAATLERRGVEIFEFTAARAIDCGRVETDGGTIRAAVVVRAVEAYTAELPGLRRLIAPMYSTMIATVPISEDRWAEIGFARRETFGDLRHLVIYGQRTADGRIAFGGRGAPYAFGSRVRDDGELPVSVFDFVHAQLLDLLPQLRDVEIAYRWAGCLGLKRDWYPSATIDRSRKIAWAGGYVGSGVAAANLAGRTLADLILARDTELTRFPWVSRPVRRWEPEPFRWLGINAAIRVLASADREEVNGNASRRAERLWRLIGR